MTEDEVVERFSSWLVSEGWTITEPIDRWLDIYAVRGEERLHVEAKGVTTSPGIDADTAWGQILRRMTDFGHPGARYALVCPESVARHMLRVPAVVRDRLGVEVYAVRTDGVVTFVQLPM